MDRQIPKETIKKEHRRRLMGAAVVAVILVAVIATLTGWMRSSVSAKNLQFATVDKGTIEVSISASGKVVPAFEEIINSPINTRILEVYRRGGDSVEVGTPLLKLDLQTAETDYKKGLDEEQMKGYKLAQLKVTHNTRLTNLQMQIKVAQMKLNRMQVEARNERYLDSIGAGTADKVHQAELNYNVARLELEQQRKQYQNEKQACDAEYKIQQLDLNIYAKALAEIKRTLDDAQIRAPRKAILTYINNQVGAQISQGQQVAVISDLSHFKIDAEIADSYGDRVSAGGKVIAKIGSEKLEGVVGSVTPLSKNGVISFTVQLMNDHHKRLRSGLKTDVYLMTAVKEQVMRLANRSFYSGPGSYDLFVQTASDELTKRKVTLGESNFEYVEVLSGLNPGDKVVVSDMSDFKNKQALKLK